MSCVFFFHNACKKLLFDLWTGTRSLGNWESEWGQVLLYIQNYFLLSLHYHDKPRPKLHWAEMSILAGGFPSDTVVKNLPANAEDVLIEMRVWSLGWEDPLEKEMETHSSILAWRIPWTEKPGGLQSMGSQRLGHNLATKQQQLHTWGKWAQATDPSAWLTENSGPPMTSSPGLITH